MDRAEIVCRLLAGVFLWCGMVGLALYILWTMETGFTDLHLLVQTIQDVLEAKRGRTASKTEVFDQLFSSAFDHPTQWVAWYYSPLNLHYWAMAMLFFSPALGCSLLARGAAGRRRRQGGRD